MNQSPALTSRAPDYPAQWQSRVPKCVRLRESIRTSGFKLWSGKQLSAYVDSHGRVYAVTPQGMVELQLCEYEVVEWHAQAPAPAPAPVRPVLRGRWFQRRCFAWLGRKQ